MEPIGLEQTTSIEKVFASVNQEHVIANKKTGDGYTNNLTIFNADQDAPGLKRNPSARGRVSKTLYLQIHRQASNPSTSAIVKIKGRYEPIDKENDCKVNSKGTANNAQVPPSTSTKQVDDKAKRLSDAGDQRSPEELLSKTQSNIEKLQSSLSSKLSTSTIEHLRNKYSPAGFGYPKRNLKTNSPKKVQFSESVSKIPIPTPRVSKDSANLSDKESIRAVVVKEVSVVPQEPKLEEVHLKDENSNVLVALDPAQSEESVPGVEVELLYENIKFAKPEDKHFIVRRCSSEDSIEKFESFLSEFVMDQKTKERKRSNSFRKLFTGGIFGKDKKKADDGRLKNQKKDNVAFSDNVQNESQVFDRKASHRHTVDSTGGRRETRQRLEEKPPSGPLYYYSSSKPFRKTEERDTYTDMSNSGSFVSNRPPKYSPEHYLPMNNSNSDLPLTYNGVNRYLDTSSSSSNTIDYENRNGTYQNALIAQAELRQIRENQSKLQQSASKNYATDNCSDTSGKSSDSPERFREVPPHSSKNLQLVKPKALIPINSERPLPNPYHNKFEKIKNTENYENFELSQTLNRNLNLDSSKPYPEKTNLYNKDNGNQIVVDDVYGTVFDSISPQRSSTNVRRCASPDEKVSLSPSKLKLPPNREKVELQPRIRSPIPQAKVSTDKIIATELLRNKRSPTRTPSKEQPDNSFKYSSPARPSSYQGVYENSFEFPSHASTPMHHKTSSSEYMHLNQERPPNPPQSYLQAAEWHKKQRELDKSPAIETTQQVTTDVIIHTNPLEHRQGYSNPPSPAIKPKNLAHMPSPTRYVQVQTPSPKPNNSPINVPLQLQIHRNSPSPTSKSGILQNVEAFYWRELRKLKDKEEQDLFNYRHRQIQVYGYIEDPVLTRRSRSASPGTQRGRRSLSLPRDGRSIQQPPIRGAIPNPEPIPEGRPVIAKRPIALPIDSRPVERNPNFIRNTFERSTIGPIGFNQSRQFPEDISVRRQTTPIFKRGSLTGPPQESPYQLGKKVSFSSNQNQTSWPTKNGFTKSPPTRRVDREMSMEDDVFLPNAPISRVEDLYVQRNYDGPQGSQANRHFDYVNGGGAPQNESLYGSKRITIFNKVCDMYGQIHDPRQKPPEPPRNYSWVRGQDETAYGQIRQSGLVYGQLQHSNSVRQNQVPQQNFVRGTRLTASVNDMYRRYPAENVHYVESRPKGGVRYVGEQGPQRPLPPVPERHDSRAISVRKLIRGYVPVSDESGSEAGEVQRILRSGSQQRSYNVIGK